MFDAAREPLAPQAAGWVYRSDPTDARTPPPPAAGAVPAPAAAATPTPAAPIAPLPAPAAPAAARPAADAAPPRTSLTTGVDRLLSPVALALTIVLAPFGCFAGPRSRR